MNTPADLADLLAIADDATAAAAVAYLGAATTGADPADWKAYTHLANARRFIAAAMVAAGVLEPAP